MRMLLAREAERSARLVEAVRREAAGVCSGGGGGVTDSAGEIGIAGGSSAVEEGVGDGDS